MSLVDDGAKLRIATLSQHGPFQDLLNLLDERQQILAESVLDTEDPSEIGRAQREARGFRDAVVFIKTMVAGLAREYEVGADGNVRL